eukprot:1176043-Pyramimonas_sp.AAC.1
MRAEAARWMAEEQRLEEQRQWEPKHREKAREEEWAPKPVRKPKPRPEWNSGRPERPPSATRAASVQVCDRPSVTSLLNTNLLE